MKLINYITKLFALTLLSVIILAAAASAIYAGNGKKNRAAAKQTELWRETDKRTLAPNATRSMTNEAYRVFRLNNKALKQIFAAAPLEFTDEARGTETVLHIPMPDGILVRFRIEESPMLAPEVAAQYPTWKQYSGQGIDDPTAIARFDTNVSGFHGYIVTERGTFLIDPYSLTDQVNYVVYYKGDLNAENAAFSCSVKENKEKRMEFLSALAPTAFTNGATLKNFRLAVSATKEYTNFFGGNQATAFAAIQTTVNRMITVYRRDLAVTFTLVSDTRTVFTNAADGGFPAASDPNVADGSLNRNQIVLDNTYGNVNYDIGHAVSQTPNPNGLAASPSLCDPTAKAQGFTGAPTPQGDGFDVDYVAHEIGHQFSMSHTFNNDADGSCSTRETDSAFEPASGVTIMGYGGICAPRNLSANSIEYFNLRSFDQALSYLQTTVPANYPGCGTNTATGNTPPTVTVAAASYNIPKQTPFTLTANGADADGDALTYLWEEFDLGAATRSTGAVDTDEDGTARPIFRAYNPTDSGSRTFPILHYILNNANVPPLTYQGTLPFAPTSGSTAGYVCAAGETCVTGERLPSISRTMNFRVTVRDNRAGGGGVQDASTNIVVSGAAGPFQVTAQNTFAELSPAVTWQANTAQTVTWDVAGTNAAPINAANVNILLSTDGGLTFPFSLKANTPNDGTESITVPNNPTTQARIKIEAVGNVFFDINNANFQITPPTAASVSIAGRVLSAEGSPVPRAVIRMIDQSGNVRVSRTNPFGYYSFAEVAVGQTCVFTVTVKGYQFMSRVITITENLEGLDFTAQ